MDRKAILGHGVGTVFASKVRFGDWHNAVRLLDTQIWRHTRHAGNDHRYYATTKTKTDAGTGYLVLRLLNPGNMTDERRATMIEHLATVNLTVTDLINDDGTINEGAVPAEMCIDIRTAREFTTAWAHYRAEQDAERIAYEAQVEADRARYAAENAARQEQYERHTAAINTAREQCRIIGAAMDHMGIDGGHMSPKNNVPGTIVRVEINLAALNELVNRAMRATADVEDNSEVCINSECNNPVRTGSQWCYKHDRS